jgi:hypothetical protein
MDCHQGSQHRLLPPHGKAQTSDLIGRGSMLIFDCASCRQCCPVSDACRGARPRHEQGWQPRQVRRGTVPGRQIVANGQAKAEAIRSKYCELAARMNKNSRFVRARSATEVRYLVSGHDVAGRVKARERWPSPRAWLANPHTNTALSQRPRRFLKAAKPVSTTDHAVGRGRGWPGNHNRSTSSGNRFSRHF